VAGHLFVRASQKPASKKNRRDPSRRGPVVSAKKIPLHEPRNVIDSKSIGAWSPLPGSIAVNSEPRAWKRFRCFAFGFPEAESPDPLILSAKNA
jgi:hypothetical protein